MASEAEITVTAWRTFKSGGTLQGFLTLKMPSGMVIHDCQYHERSDGTRWIGLPVREYTKPDGEKGWSRIVDFATKESYSRFQKAAREAIDRYFGAQSAESASVTREDVDWAALGGKR